MTYILTVHIAPVGTQENLTNGNIIHAPVGHMWYSISDGSNYNSYGFEPQVSGNPFMPGKVVGTDTKVFQGSSISTQSVVLTQDQYLILKKFGNTGIDLTNGVGGIIFGTNGVNFNTYYNALTNSCIDFTWAALAQIGIQQPLYIPGTELLPQWNESAVTNAFKQFQPSSGSVTISYKNSYTYDAFNDITSITTTDINNNLVSQTNYQYNLVNNSVTITTTNNAGQVINVSTESININTGFASDEIKGFSGAILQYDNTKTLSVNGAISTDNKLYDPTSGKLKQEVITANNFSTSTINDPFGNPIGSYQIDSKGNIVQGSFASNITLSEFSEVTASALATQVIAQFLFKNKLPASALAQAFSTVVFDNLFSSPNTQAISNTLTPSQKIVAEYGIDLAKIVEGIGGSVAGAALFKQLGLPTTAGSVVGSVLSPSVVNAILTSAKADNLSLSGVNAALNISDIEAGLASVGGASIGSYLGADLSKLVIGSPNQGASFGGAVGSTVGVIFGTDIGAAIVSSSTVAAAIATTIATEIGATVGSVIPVIGTIIGATLGSFLGSVIGSIFGPGKSVGPNAAASIGYNQGTSRFYFLSTATDNGGDASIATNLANATIAETNGIAAAIGGHIVQNLGGFGMGYYQQTGFFAYFNRGDDKHNVYSTPQAAIDNAIIRLAHMETIQGGNPFMEYALAHSSATSVSALLSDLNAAYDYGNYLANPVLFDLSIAMGNNATTLSTWLGEMTQAQALGLGTAPSTSDLSNGILTETGAYVNAHLELLNDFRTSGLITGITLTDGAITVNANQASQYNNLISLISNRNSITVMDTNASVSANIITLNSLTTNNLIASVIITDSPSSYLNNTSLTIAANKIQTITGYGNTVTASTGDTLIFNSFSLGKNTINAANGDTLYFYGNASTVAGGVVDNINLSNGLLEAGKGACLNLRGSGDTVIENANVTLSIFGNNNGIRGADGETIYQDLGGGYTISVGVNSVINLAGNGTTGATGGVDNVTLSSGRVNILASYSNVTGADVVINGYSNSIAITSADNIIINGGGNNLTASGTLNSISISGNGSKGANGGVNTVTMSGGAVNLLANADAIVSGYGDTVIAAAGDTVTFNSTSVGGSNLTIGTGATVNFSGNASLVANGIIDNVNASGDVVNVATGACFNLRGSNDSVIEGDNAILTVFGNNNGIQGGAHETIYQDFGGGYNISVGNNSVVNLAGNGTTGATGGVDKVSLSNGRVNLNTSNSTVTGTDATISGNNNSVYAVSLDTVSINGANDTVFVNGSGDVVNIAGNGQTLNAAMLDTVNISSGTVNVASYASAIINGNNNTVWTGNNSNANVQGNNDTINIGSNNIITIGNGTGDSLISWGNNNTITGANGDSLIEGGGGYNTYQFARGNGSETITKNASSGLGTNGELDFASGIATNQLWFLRNGNNLQIDVMGTHDQLTIVNWFGSANSQFKEIKTSDGSMIDAQLTNLVQGMATYSGSHSGFNPITATSMPTDTSLQNTLAAAWHH